jgi:twinkle protein
VDAIDEDGVMMTPDNAEYKFHSHRGISQRTFEFYGVYTEFVEGEPTKIGFKYPNDAIKFREFSEKKFYSQGPMSEAGLFGKDKFDPGSKKSITITEGEYDALSVYEISNGNTAAVSVRSGSSARLDCTRDWDYINSFSRIILAFDADEVGQRAAKEVASLFDFQRVYHVTLNRHKDANAYLQAEEASDFYDAWAAAKRYAPDNIISTLAEFEESLKEAKEDILATYPFKQLQEKLYGLHAGEVIVFKGMEGIGKTEIFRAIEHHILSTTKHNVGILHLEEDNGETVKALAGYELQQPCGLPDSNVSNSEILKAVAKLAGPNEDRIHIHSSFDVEDEGGILDNIRFLVSASKCKFIFLDHISWLATGNETDDDERKKLDRISQKLKLLAKELRFCLIMISHVNDEGKTRGSRNITKVANTVIHLDRDVTSSDTPLRLSTFLTVEKARLRGAQTGKAGAVILDTSTFTLRDTKVEDDIKVPRLAS